ncbi:MAG TPA: glycoside hydrolase family 9 protein [Longimicrobiaceae bacterium]|nr:glycoside hydrolase family 9 protein [Longimicrobiaceae bacterium]
MRLRAATLLALATLLAAAAGGQGAEAPKSFIRVNQVGYLPDAPKVAVVCSLEPVRIERFEVVDASGRRVLARPAREDRPFAACASTHRLDFSSLTRPGTYRIRAGGAASPPVRIGANVYAGGADTLLAYMRQQRSGFNPVFRDSVHERTDAILVDHPEAGRFIPVTGGWADAADYLQYVTTSANAAFVMLMAYRDHPGAFPDRHAANGLPGANGIPDVLDEARHGLEWLVRMFPHDSLMLNQLGDDRDHSFPDLPPTDSSDYGWGKGGYRPVYPCTGKPQGLLRYRNRANGYASTAGKYASAMALGARLLAERDPAFADTLRRRAAAAYELGRRYPGACQTAPARAPYFYEEDNWVDDMELGAAQMHALTGEARYLAEAVMYARQEPVTPWMGADTARHYQWYPWHNNGHHEVWRQGGAAEKQRMVEYYRQGLERVVARAGNGFRVGIPFIWCSNNLMASFATQAYLYRAMTGDNRFREYEQAALDWLFGTNPWGVSMVIGYPAAGNTPRDPHSILSNQIGVHTQLGGLVDGPVYVTIFRSLQWVRLVQPDEYAAFNTGDVVYHDDFGDYSTNEPIMDGTANLTYLLAALAR